jgi:hypothetical protein
MGALHAFMLFLSFWPSMSSADDPTDKTPAPSSSPTTSRPPASPTDSHLLVPIIFGVFLVLALIVPVVVVLARQREKSEPEDKVPPQETEPVLPAEPK